jgi:hypothetical protein
LPPQAVENYTSSTLACGLVFGVHYKMCPRYIYHGHILILRNLSMPLQIVLQTLLPMIQYDHAEGVDVMGRR